jgi:UPF0755 protein
LTDSDPPLNGKPRAAPSAPAQTPVGSKAGTSVPNGKPAAKPAAPAAKSATQQTSAASKSVQPPPTAQKPAPAAVQKLAPAVQKPPPAPPVAGKPQGASNRPSATSAAPPSRGASRAVPGAGEPYPPISQRTLNGMGSAPAGAKNSKPLTPRSPRTAIEPDTVEIPTRRSKSVRNPFVVVGNAIISLFVLAAIVVGAGLVVGKQRFEAPGPLAEDRVVNIPRGVGIRDIAEVLEHDGVIDQPWVFVGGVLVLKAREGLKAGEYQFKAHASIRDVVATIVDGRVVAHQATIPEGLTSEQIVARLLDDDVLAGNIKEIPREGTLLPDTYNFTRGITREQMIQRMQQAQQRFVKDTWERRSPDLPLKTPEQLVILASLIEKETGKPEERTRIAAVFVNRLKQKMRLQSDPTIIYGLVGGKGTLGRPIMKSEIDQPTAYNTYQIDGLPPGPIDNPGRAALEAAANPARTRELYFVADGTGGHTFAESYEQHQKNVARLRAFESDQKDQAPAANAQPAATPPQPAPASVNPAPQPPHRASNHRTANPPAAAPTQQTTPQAATH